MKKEDGRVIYTKIKIREAFNELLKDNPADKITVTAICTKAEINRATFYKHYLDVPDLVEKLQEELLESLSAKMNSVDQGSIRDFLVSVLDFLKNDYNGNSFWNKLDIVNPGTFVSKLSNVIYKKFSSVFEPYEKKNPALSRDTLFAYISAGSAGLIDYWVKSGFRESEAEMAEKIVLLCSSTMKNL